MKTKIAAGFLAGVTAAVGIPVFAQTGTVSSSPAAKDEVVFRHKGPMTHERAMLANMDALVAIHKDAMQDHVAALEAAATIEDDTAREEAVHAAHVEMKTSIQAALEANPALADLRGPMMFGGHHGRGAHGGKEMFFKHIEMRDEAESSSVQ